MNSTNTSLALAVAGAFTLSIGVTGAQAASNPFAIKSLSNGYQIADASADASTSTDTGNKIKDGKCSTGKCGANKKKAMAKEMKEKAKEGNCSADMKTKDGSCSAEMKAKAGVSDKVK